MATEFISTLNTSGADYSLVATWEAHTDIALSAATTKVFTHGGITGTVSVGDTVTGSSSSTTATVTAVVTATQILVVSISGSGFTSGERMEVDASNHVTLSDTGDSPQAVLEINTAASPITAAVQLIGATTDATNGAPGTVWRHIRSATPGTKVNITNAAGTFGVVYFTEDDVHLTDLDLTNTSTGNSSYGVRCAKRHFVFDSCILRAGSTGTNSNCMENQIAIGGSVRNTLAVGGGGNGFDLASGQQVDFENCGAVNSGQYGFEQLGTSGAQPSVVNCFSFNTTLAGFQGTHWTGNNNASDDSTEPGTSPITTDLVAGDFVDTTDFRTASGSTLANAGADLSGTFTRDIDGDTRTTPWDVGISIEAAGGGVTGTATNTINTLAQSATGTYTAPAVTGTAINTVNTLAQSGTGAHIAPVLGVASSAINTLAQALAGAHGVSGAATSDINTVSQSAAGSFAGGVSGVATSAISALGQSAAGNVPDVVTGTASSQITALQQDSTGVHGVAGAAASSINQLAQAASGFLPVTGVALSDINTLGQSAVGSGGVIPIDNVAARRASRLGRFKDTGRGGDFRNTSRSGRFL